MAIDGVSEKEISRSIEGNLSNRSTEEEPYGLVGLNKVFADLPTLRVLSSPKKIGERKNGAAFKANSFVYLFVQEAILGIRGAILNVQGLFLSKLIEEGEVFRGL